MTDQKPVTTEYAKIMAASFAKAMSVSVSDDPMCTLITSLADQLDAANADNEARQRISRKDQETITQLRHESDALACERDVMKKELDRRSGFTPEEVSKEISALISQRDAAQGEGYKLRAERDKYVMWFQDASDAATKLGGSPLQGLISVAFDIRDKLKVANEVVAAAREVSRYVGTTASGTGDAHRAYLVLSEALRKVKA